jgi:hypothetical protein
MLRLQTVLPGVMFFGFASSAIACNPEGMVGRWKCNGPSCTPGHDVSEFAKNEDGSFRWVDGVGTVSTAVVGNVNITVTFPNGTQYSGVIVGSCHQIQWPGNNHYDTKE